MATILTDDTVTHPDGSTVRTITYSDGGTSVQYTPGAGTPNANAVTLLAQATAAFIANRADITQAEAISTQAAALAATTGTFTLAQASTHIRALAQAVKVLADHDVSAKKQMNAAMRLILQNFDGTD